MDLNGDGKLDIISGQYAPPLMTFFEGTDKGFKKGVFIEEVGIDSKNIAKIPVDLYQGSSCFADINGDGLYDLVVGANSGEVYINLNEGTAKAFKFGQRQKLMLASGKPVKVMRSKPTVADWDGDGVPDLLVGDDMGGVTFFKGIKPQAGKLMTFEAGVSVIPGKKQIVPGYRARPHVVDWNNDGKLDLLVGNCEQVEGRLTGFVYLFLRK